MRTNVFSSVVMLWVALSSAAGAPPALMNLHCLSVRLNPASASTLGVNYTFTVGTAGEGGSANGELAPLFGNGPTSHGSRFSLGSEIYLEPIPGTLYLDLPATVDENTNIINDFFEVSMPVSASSTGVFVDDLTGEEGKVQANWNRGAGSTSGTCQLRLSSSFVALTFTHSFSIWEYDGQLEYTPADGSVTGRVSLVDFTPATNTLSGMVVFDKLDQDHLAVRAGGWTNGALQTWSYLATPDGEAIVRDGTNYVGFLDAANGDPVDGQSGFNTWIIHIGDANDTNRNGIPDVSDAPAAAARAPKLSILRNAGELRLNIQGDAGLSYRIEQTERLGSTNWTGVATLVLTNSPQSYPLTTPTNATLFWRVRTP
jgi:hypothetical protein